MKHADKRNEIMSAALELISKQGFHKAPMSRIAEKAGVGAGTIYLYFESKDMLIKTLYRELENEIMTAIQKGYPESESFRERFIHIWTSLLRYFIANPLHFRYLEQYHNSPYGVSMRRDRILSKTGDSSIFIDLFEEGVSSHTVKDLPIIMLFALAFGPMVFLARDHTLALIKLQDAHIVQAATACWEAIENK
jgi:AcrR family transcriptional regulator